MNIKIVFDFHDVFVNAKESWLKAFMAFTNSKQIKQDCLSGIPTEEICKKHNLIYPKVEKQYQKLLKPISANIEFAKKLSKCYPLDIISLSEKQRLLKDLDKVRLTKYFKNIYSKPEVQNKLDFLRKVGSNYDWIVYFNHDLDTIEIYDNVVYVPIDLQGNLTQFKDISFTEHAKHKLLYNELSAYYMKAIANDTNLETSFIKNIFQRYFSKKTGKILDCCCGVGRHSYALAMEGFHIVGIDFSEKQIDTAKSIHSHKNINYFVQDARNIKLDHQKFDMAICMWTTYNYLSQERDLLKFIQGLYRHQKKGDILILDSKNIPRLEQRRVYKRTYESIQDKIIIELIINKFVMDNIQNSQYLYFIDDKGNKNFYFDEEFVRFYTVNEINKIAKDYYSVEEIYGDFDMSDYDKRHSNRFILVMRRK